MILVQFEWMVGVGVVLWSHIKEHSMANPGACLELFPSH